MVSRGGLVALADLSERVRQARRREDHDLVRHRSPRQEKRESEGDGTNPRIHATHPLPPLARAILRPHNYRTVHPQATRDTAASIDQKRRPRSALQRFVEVRRAWQTEASRREDGSGHRQNELADT